MVNENNNGVHAAAVGPENVDKIAEKKNATAHRKGISHEEMVDKYTEWANDYEKDLCPGVYNGPKIAVDVMAHYFHEEDRPTLKILDIAAGTGVVGVELARKGFKLIDALEPSQGMMDILAEKGIYYKMFLNPIGYEPIVDIQADSYDAVVIAGGMGEGHIPIEGINEMLRVVRPDGMIFIVMREEYLTIVEEYTKLEAFMQALVDKQVWIKIERKVVPKYSFENNGVVYVYQKR